MSFFCGKNFLGGSVGSGREVHGKENPRKHYAVGLRTEPAHLVRGSSRRITIMRFRPANIRVINRRNSRLDRDLRCLLRKDGKKKENKEEEKTKRYLTRSFHISVLPSPRPSIIGSCLTSPAGRIACIPSNPQGI